MALPLPPASKIDDPARPPAPANQQVTAAEWNQLVQAVGEMQSQIAGMIVIVTAYDAAAVPEASASLANRLISVTTADQPSQLQVCLPNSAGGYEWVILQQST